MWILLLALATCIQFSQTALPLPSYITPCMRGQPEFDECALKTANEVFPHLIPGDAKYKIPQLEPIDIDEIKVIDGGPRSAKLNMVLRKTKIYGVKDTVVRNVSYDFEKQHIQHQLWIPRLELIGKYEATGNILVMPIVGKGGVNITLENTTITYDEDYTLVIVDGNRHISPKNPRAEAIPSRIYFRLEQLFNGDTFLTNQLNTFLNENWRDVYAEMSPTITQIFTKLVVAIISGFDQLVPFDAMFPEMPPQ